MLINEEIREKEVRVLDSDGTQLGVISTKEALKIASEKNLDLVNIAPQATPPACRIMDYGKYLFELNKKEKEAKKKQKVVNLKEIRVSTGIEEHDFNVKLKHLLQFLKDGDKVKITVRFKGREVNHPKLGDEVLDKFTEAIGESANIEKRSRLEGRNMTMIVSPK